MQNYIIQVVLFQVLFLGIYEAFLKKETFFQWNRFYLLFTAVLAYVIPFIQIKMLTKYIPENLNVTNFYATDFSDIRFENSKTILEKSNYFTLQNSYYLGLILMSLWFLVKLIQLLKKIYSNQVISKKEYKLVLLKKEKKAFSFFDYIFLGNEIYKKDHQHILQHELVHVKEKHSLDLLFFEIQKILFWFNPFVYIYQYKIAVLHEYIADKKTIKSAEKQTFYKNLLLQTFQIETLPFVNQYYKKSLLKKRIMMATKNKSRQILKMKYLLVIPVLLLMIAIASCDTKNDDSIEKKDAVSEVEPFATLDKVPVYPGCENIADAKEQKTCFSEKVNKFISSNFNADLVKESDLPAGKHKILAQFIIDKTGVVTDVKVRAPHPKLKEEALRVIQKLPKMQAGEKNGKKVSVRYNLPIIFKVDENASTTTKKITDKNLEGPPAPPTPIKPITIDTLAIQKNLTGRIYGVFGYLYLRKEIVKKGLIDAYSFKSKQTYPVKSFSLQILNNVYHISGNKISQDIVNKIDQLTKGDKIKIFDIKTENIDNSQVEPINIKIKDV